MSLRPDQSIPGIMHRGGEPVLRGLPVIDHEHTASHSRGQPSTDGVVLINIRQDPAAAVIIHQNPGRPFNRLQQAGPDLAPVAGRYQDIANLVHIRAIGIGLGHGRPDQSRLCRRKLGQRGPLGRCHLCQEGRTRNIQIHVLVSSTCF